MQDALDITNTLRKTLSKFPNYAQKMLGNGTIKISLDVCDMMRFLIVCVLQTIVTKSTEAIRGRVY